jgi:hypothetical protein
MTGIFHGSSDKVLDNVFGSSAVILTFWHELRLLSALTANGPVLPRPTKGAQTGQEPSTTTAVTLACQASFFDYDPNDGTQT